MNCATCALLMERVRSGDTERVCCIDGKNVIAIQKCSQWKEKVEEKTEDKKK